MFGDVGAFLDWFEGVHRRTVRDVSMLPEDAQTWLPPVPDPESGVAWGVPDLVAHLAESRPYFAGAFVGRGWVWETTDRPSSKTEWIAALEDSLAALRDGIGRLGPDAFTRRVELIGAPDRTVSAWRVLMMMAEHEIAHRAQIGTYAGLNGWPTSQLFGRTNEWVRAQRDEQIARRGTR